jgi:predicted RNase H-like nuclease
MGYAVSVKLSTTWRTALPAKCAIERVEAYIGFDSAWADNPRAPGAITAIVRRGTDAIDFHAPIAATFDGALEFIERVGRGADYLLVGLDQPTIVSNFDGCRPVERVAASLVSKLGGGVQPARRNGGGARMFGDGAPVWSFLARLKARQNPFEARDRWAGRFLVEVFPALALPTFVPAIWSRKAAAKYNPTNKKKLRLDDWSLVASTLAEVAAGAQLQQLGLWFGTQAVVGAPVKTQQDCLDAAICLLIAYSWRNEPVAKNLLIGDGASGYMITPVSPEIRALLTQSAVLRDVPVDRPWVGDATADNNIPGCATGLITGAI